MQCYSCHGINGGGGPVGPDLGLGGKRDPEMVRALLRNPSAHNAHTIMPAYQLPKHKEDALVAYIVSIGPNSKMPPIPPTEPEKPRLALRRELVREPQVRGAQGPGQL